MAAKAARALDWLWDITLLTVGALFGHALPDLAAWVVGGVIP